MEKLYELLDGIYDEIVDIRRYLHQHPELSFEEVETPNYIASYHKKLGHEVRTEVGGCGVVATLHGKGVGPTVALRADFDALPIQEETDVPYKSKVDGVMHACGHDGHTATLLGLAKALNHMKEELEGNVVFIHQHAEEVPPGGAIAMIEDGCLDGVDAILGTHLLLKASVGEIGYRIGAITSQNDTFEIEIQGKGGHGSKPHETKDSIVIGSNLVTSLQQIVSRRVDPQDVAVLSIGSFEAKNSHNVIADKAILKGSVRTFSNHTQDFIEKEIEKVTKGICLTGDMNYTYQYTRGYPATFNHKEETELIVRKARSVPGVRDVQEIKPLMPSEDFSYYLQHVKGCYFFTGARNPDWKEWYPNHHPKFNIDERALLIAAKVLGAATLGYMNK